MSLRAVIILKDADLDRAVGELAWGALSYNGQQVNIFGSDAAVIGKLMDPFVDPLVNPLVNQICRVNINSPRQRGPDMFPFFGRTDSAEGTLSVSDALKVFSIRTVVAAKITETNKALLEVIVRGHHSSFITNDFVL